MRAAEQELGAAAAAARAARADGDRGLAARQHHAGPGERLAAPGDLPGQRRVDLADLARFALDLVAEDVRLDAGGARRGGGGFERPLRRGDDVHRVAGEGRRRRAWASPARRSRGRARIAARDRDRVAVQHRQRIGAGGRIGHRRAAADGRRRSRRARRSPAGSRPAPARRPRASRPPLIADRCFLTQFISSIAAPLFSSARLIACFSSRLTPSAGRASSDEAPPEIRQRTRSSPLRPRASAPIRAAARRPASSGTGWAASTTSIRVEPPFCRARTPAAGSRSG